MGKSLGKLGLLPLLWAIIWVRLVDCLLWAITWASLGDCPFSAIIHYLGYKNVSCLFGLCHCLWWAIICGRQGRVIVLVTGARVESQFQCWVSLVPPAYCFPAQHDAYLFLQIQTASDSTVSLHKFCFLFHFLACLSYTTLWALLLSAKYIHEVFLKVHKLQFTS